MKYLTTIGAIMMATLLLVVFGTIAMAHERERFHKHPVDQESCESALEGIFDQIENRGTVNPRLVENAESKCGFDGDLLGCIGEGGELVWSERAGELICLTAEPVPPPATH